MSAEIKPGMNQIPPDYQYKSQGSLYKVGLHGKVYIWLGWWHASEKTVGELGPRLDK